MLKVQFWSPDTCDCALFEAWDSEDASVVHAYVTRAEAQQIVDRIPTVSRNPMPQPEARLCPAHQQLGHTKQLYAAVLGENRLKNLTLLLTSVDAAWSFDDARLLHIRPKVRSRFDLQACLDLAFGPGRVVVDA
jgi:hypothetical protein